MSVESRDVKIGVITCVGSPLIASKSNEEPVIAGPLSASPPRPPPLNDAASEKSEFPYWLSYKGFQEYILPSFISAFQAF